MAAQTNRPARVRPVDQSVIAYNSGGGMLRVRLRLMTHPRGHLFQRLKLLVGHQIELVDEVIEVFVAGVDVSFSAYGDHSVKVMNVDVYKHSEETTQDFATQRHKALGERHIDGDWEHFLIVDLRLYPVHQQADVLTGWQGSGFLVFFAIRPQILEFGAAAHGRARRLSAVVTDGTINEVDTVEEINNMYCNPVIEVFIWRKFDYLSQVDA